MNYRTDLILGEAFYMFIFWSFISQILGFLSWLVFGLNPRSLPEHELPYVEPCWHVKRWFDDAKPIGQQFLLQRFFQWQRPQVSFFKIDLFFPFLRGYLEVAKTGSQSAIFHT